MVDTVAPEVRSRMMAAVKSKDTSIETAVRKALHAAGFRYRIHKKIGKSRPDILLPKHSAAIFVHGCFWHGHAGCRYSRTPKSNIEFWTTKIERNMVRDAHNEEEMAGMGWRVALVWECAIKDLGVAQVSGRIADWLRGRSERLEIKSDGVTGGANRPKAAR
ncbi:DNA mismatch endonuclease Vsr [Rhizobium laguerreae]|nr:DNA mismatch endonuclease Vsr [Rhizobium laguerreae]